MKTGRKIVKRAMAILLAFATIFSTDAANIMTVFAEGAPGNAYTLKLNDKECMGSEPVSVAYGEPIALKLDGLESGTVTYYYSKYKTFEDEQKNPSLLDVIQDSNDFTKGLEIGTVYYLGYTVWSEAGYSQDYNGNHCFKVVPATIASPANVLWDGYVAKWDGVTTDSLNYALDEGAVSGYEVSLYQMNGETKVPVVLDAETEATSAKLASDATSYDFTSVITGNGYSDYVFEVKAIAETSTGHYADSASVGSGKLVYTDEAAPQITVEPSFDEQTQTLSFAAKDDESGIVAFAITTKTSAEDLVAEDWVAIENPGAGNVADASRLKLTLSSDCQQGEYCFYVKDAYNHVTKAESAIGLRAIQYKNDGNGTGVSDTVWFAAATGEYTLKTPTRQGYSFLGWYDNAQLTGEPVTTVDASAQYSEDIAVYASWKFDDVQFSKHPNDGNNLSFTYDGTAHSVVAAIANTDGTITWEWEKLDNDTQEWSTVSGQNSDTLTVCHVADSGKYRAKVTLTIGSDVSTVSSNEIDVTILPAPLTLTVDNASITYGQDEPVYTYTPSGFVGQDIEVKPAISAGTIRCPEWDAAENNNTLPLAKGSYDITLSGFAADDYKITPVDGILTIGAKSVEAEDSTVSASLSQTEYVYGVQQDGEGAYTPVAHTPSVTVYDGDKKISTDEYTVQYFNNVNAGTAYVEITFHKNYTGKLTKNYTIAKAEFSSETQIKREWKYGAADAGEPSVTTNVSGGTVSYYYLDSESNPLKSKPVNAGTYYVYAVIGETSNYKACTTEKVSFEIKPREITITAASGTWEYDGNAHILDSYKQTGDGFASGDDFQSVTVIGTITNKGTADNVISYCLPESVNASNYSITAVNGTLTVTQTTLQTPGGVTWDDDYLNAGVAKWVPVVKTNLEIQYEVQLYRKESNGTYTKVGNAIETQNAEYDFKSAIYDDAMTQYKDSLDGEDQRAICYAFSVRSKPKSGSAMDNYKSSAVSDYRRMETLGTNYVTFVPGVGISSFSACRNYENNEMNTIDLSNTTMRSFVVLQKERITFNAVCESMYRVSANSWTITPGEGYTYSSSVDSGYLTSNAQINAPSVITDDATGKVYVGVQCTDREPLIKGFSATLSADMEKGTLHIVAADGIGLSAYQVVRKETEVKSQTITPEENAWVTTGISSDGKSLSTDVDVTDYGFYYLFVKDTSGNISYTEDPIRIYKIEFAKGEASVTGTMHAILKLENQDITIPTHTFENAGKTFKNWKTKNNTILEEGASYVLNQNDTLTATWTGEQYSYTVRYHYQDMKQDTAEETPVLYYKTDEELAQAGETLKTQNFKAGYEEVVDPTKEAYSAILSDKQGFELDQEKTQTIKVTENGLVLDLYYKRSQFEIVYTYTNVDGLKLTHDTQTYYYGQLVAPLGIPGEKAGYSFEGWTYENLSEVPQTMPAQNISATGIYVAQTVDYYVVYYYETLTEGTYALGSTETCHATQGDEITMSLGDISTAKGFRISAVAAVKEKDLSYQCTVPTGASDQATGTATAEAGEKLYFVYYMNREKYDITLNVWKGDRLSSGEKIYSYVWENIPYGTPISEEQAIAYETHGMTDEWEQGAKDNNIDLDGYVVADYVDWSTETRPATMPYGDVVISREYVLATLVPYNVDIYLENADGSYSKNGSLIYYGYLGDTATAGPLDSDTINYNKLVENVASLKYYQYKSVDGEVLSGKIVEGDENSRLHIKLYFERKSYQVTLAFYDGTSKVFHQEQIYRKWGTTFEFSPEQCFDYTITEGETGGRTYTEGTDSSATSSFRNKKYIVSYSTYYWDTDVNSYGNANGHYSNDNMDSYEELHKQHSVKVGMNDGTYVHVYYTEPEVDKQYYYNVGYNATGLTYGVNQFVPLVINAKGTDYKIRVANKRYLYDATPIAGIGDSLYPGIAIKNGSYTYEGLKEGYTLKTVTYDGVTYTFPVDTEGYLYIPNTSNQFYEGNRISFNYRTGAKESGELSQGGYDLAYQMVLDYLTDYKNNHGDESAQPDPNGASTIYIHNPGSSHLCENYQENTHNYTFTFGYNNTMSLTYSLGANQCSAHSYKYNTLVTVGCEHTGVFPERQGYDIVWYTDPLYSKPAETEFHIKSHVTLYGRYEKSVRMNNEYLVFPLAETITVGGNSYSGYLTIEQVQEIQSANSTEYKVTTETTQSNITVRDQETGRDKTVTCDNTTYLLNGVPVLTNRMRPAICFSEISMEVDDVENPAYTTMQQYAPQGFKFDDTNTNNRLKGYVQYEAISLYAYFTRMNYTASMDRRLSDADNVVKSIKTYGETVSLPKLGEGTEFTKEGYDFAGWKLYQTNELDANGNMRPITDSVVKEKGDGTYYYSMPYMDTTAQAVWTPASSDFKIYHYYQTASLEYRPELVAQMEEATTADTVKISFDGHDYTDGKLYGTENTVMGLSLVKDGTVYYFDAYVSKDGEKYTVDASVLIGCVTQATFTSEQSYKVADQVRIENGDVFSYEYAVQVYKSATKTYPTTLTDEHTFLAYPSMNLSYYYRRNSEYHVNATAISTDGLPCDVTITGTGDCYYGQNVSLSAILPSGYEFKGWYAKSDIYNENSTFTEQYQNTFGENADNPTEAGTLTALENETVYRLVVTGSNDLVAVVKPLEVEEPDLSISGKTEYVYGYAASSSNVLSVGADMSKVDATTYIKSYQWNVKKPGDTDAASISGATSASYVIPAGENAGNYEYICVVTVGRTDNGATVEIPVSTNVVVKKADLGAGGSNYSYTYSGSKYYMPIEWPEGWDMHSADLQYGLEYYYSSDEEITVDNYKEKFEAKLCSKANSYYYGNNSYYDLESKYTNVRVDESGNVIPYVNYIVIHDPKGNYNDCAVKTQLTILPVELSLKANTKAFSKVYDGTTAVNGPVTDTGSQKHALSTGGYFSVTGMLSGDAEASLIDFDAVFNNAHVKDASAVYLRNIKVVFKEGETNYNYRFADNYELNIPAYITPFELDAVWSGKTEFVYNGTQQYPTAELKDGTVAPDGSDFTISVTNKQTNVGTYTAQAVVVDHPDKKYYSSDYSFASTVCEYTIVKKNILVVPVAKTFTYDGTTHYMNEDVTVSGYTDNALDMPITVTEGSHAGLVAGQTITFSSNKGYMHAGTYTDLQAENVKIEETTVVDDKSVTKNVTGNYDIHYGFSTMIINPKSVKITGIGAEDKVFDGSTDATLVYTDGEGSSAITYEGMVSGDALSYDASHIHGSFSDALAGDNKTVTITFEEGALTGDSVNDYVLDSTAQTTTASITAKGLTVTAKSLEVVYGQTIPYKYECDGFGANDANTTITGTPNYKLYQWNEEHSEKVYAENVTKPNVGVYYIEIDTSNLSNANYSISWNAAQADAQILTVKPRPIAVTATDAASTENEAATLILSKPYDGNTNATALVRSTEDFTSYYEFVSIAGVTESGVVSGDTVSLIVSGENTSFAASYNDKDVNNANCVTLNGLKIDNSNYELKSTSFAVKAKIMPLPLTLTAGSLIGENAITYGTTHIDYTVSTEGFLLSEKAEEEAKITYSSTYDAQDPAKRNITSGTAYYTVTPVYENANYAVTAISGNIEVKPAVITVTPTAGAALTYGIDVKLPQITPSFSGFQYDETESVITAGKAGLTIEEGKTTFGDASGVSFMTSAGTAVTGEVKDALPNRYGMTYQDTVIDDLTASNYTFVTGTGTLEIKRQEIRISGIKVNDKVYDGTTKVAADSIDLDGVVINYYVNGVQKTEPANKDDISSDAEKEARILNGKFSVTAAYADKNVGENKTVNLDVTLSEEFAKLYTFKSDSQTTTTATIIPAPLTITAKERSIDFGQPLTFDAEHPENYVVSGKDDEEGNKTNDFVANESYKDLYGKLTYKAVSQDASNTEYKVGSPAGDYQLVIGGFETSGTEVQNYKITFTNSSAVVLHITPATLEAPQPVWSSSAPGTITWNEVPGIGAYEAEGSIDRSKEVVVHHYIVKLYKTNVETDAASSCVDGEGGTFVSGSERIIKYQQSGSYDTTTNSYSIDYEDLIRAKGVGIYHVQIQAFASTTNNVDYKNVHQQGKLGTTAKGLFTTQITVAFASDEDSQAGKAEISHNFVIGRGETATGSYIVLAGEKDIPLQATLKNATGYTIASCTGAFADETASGSENPVGITVGEGSLTGTSYTGKLALSDAITSTAARKVVLALKPVDPTLSVALALTQDNAPYGYTSEQAPKFTVTASTKAGDTVGTEGYTYKYEWYTKDGFAGTFTRVAEHTSSSNVDSYSLPEGKVVGEKFYYAYCVVTATRKDNGKTTSVATVQNVAATVVRAAITDSKVINSAGESVSLDWQYGNPRTEFAVTVNPEHAAVTYWYCDSEAGTYTKDKPVDVGNYYVKATIAQSQNYNEFTTAPKAFAITKATLPPPTNITLSASDTAPYGKISWDAIEGPKENAGTQNDSDMTIAVKYDVKFYYEGTESNPLVNPELLKEDTTANTWYDFTKYITKAGKYRVDVTAIVANAESELTKAQGNCNDSAVASKTALINIATEIQCDCENYTKVYDGQPMTLSVNYQVGEQQMQYQWLRNNEEISGATAASYSLTYVEDSGTYTCRITGTGEGGSGNVVYSTPATATITPRPVTITSASATKTYDGQPLTYEAAVFEGTTYRFRADSMDSTEHKGLVNNDTVNYDSITSLIQSAQVTSAVAGQNTASNTMSGIVITHYDSNGSKVVYDESVAGASNNTNNYIVTKVPGTLQVNKRAITFTGDSDSKVYTGEAQQITTFTQDVSLVEGHTVNVSYLAKGTDVNTYNGTITAKENVKVMNGSEDVTGNYDIATVPGILTITKSDADWTISLADDSAVYDSAMHANTMTPQTTAKTGTTTYSYSLDSDFTTVSDSLATFTQKDVGETTIYVRATNPNYSKTATTTAKLTIQPRPVQLTWSASALTYNGSEQSVVATVSNQVSGDSINLTYKEDVDQKYVNHATEVGEYVAQVIRLDNANYTLTGATGVTENWSISHLGNAPYAYLVGSKIVEDGEWFTSEVTVKAPTGYTISTERNGTYSDSYVIDTEASDNEVSYYLKNAEGYITAKQTQAYISEEIYNRAKEDEEHNYTKPEYATTGTVKIDKTAPTGVIEIKENKFKSFINGITFGLFFKNSYDVKITAQDFKQGSDSEVGSQVAKIEYQKVAKEADYDADGSWSTYSLFSAVPNGTYIIYARITDYAGHQTIINSNGIVCYTDAQQVTSDVTFTKMQSENVEAVVATNANTIREIKITDSQDRTDTLDADAYLISVDSTDSNKSKITLKATYLQRLDAGTYTLTIFYNPYGVEYAENPGENGVDHNEAPGQTTITLQVEKAQGVVRFTGLTTNPTGLSKTYDAEAVQSSNLRFTTIPEGNTIEPMGSITVEYKLQSEGDNAYSMVAPVLAGDYVVRVTVGEDQNYTQGQNTASFTIEKKSLAITGLTAQNRDYNTLDTVVLTGGTLQGVCAVDTADVTVVMPTEGTIADANVGNDKVVSVVKPSLNGSKKDNYILESINEVKVNITPANPVITLSDRTGENSYVYDGNNISYAADGVTLVGDEIYDADVNGALSYSYRRNGTEDAYMEGLPVDAGTYQVKAVLAANGNYAESEETATITIKPLPVTLSWNSSSFVYDGAEKEVTAAITNKKEQNHVVDDVAILGYESNQKTDKGQYTAKAISLTGSKKDNYTLDYDAYASEDDYDAANISWAWNICFLPQDPTVLAYLDGTSGDNGWFISDVTLHAPEGYQLSSNWNGPFTDYMEVTAEDIHDIGYYLKSINNGEVTAEINQAYVSREAYAEKVLTKITEVIKIDKTAPTGVIEVKENRFKSFINGITFGLFFKNSYDVTITGADFKQGSDSEVGSQVAKIEYQKVAKESDYDADGSWSNYNLFSAVPNGNYIIYARITDYAGHQTIINSNGIVCYTDAQQVTADVSFTKTQTADVEAVVATNANTIREIRITDSQNVTSVLPADSYSILVDSTDSNKSKITLDADYLQTLKAGTYTLTISYHPYGLEYVKNPGEDGLDHNEAPGQTTIALQVEKAQGVVRFTGLTTNPSGLSKTYNAEKVQNSNLCYTTIPEGKTIASTGSVTVEYKLQSEGDEAYTTEEPVLAGDYVVRVSVDEDENYTQGQNTESFTIARKSLAITGLAAQNRKYDTSNTVTLTGGALEGLCAGDTADVTVEMPTEGTISDANVGNDKVVSVEMPSLNGSKKDNYFIETIHEVKVNITPADPVITLSDRMGENSYVYDGNSISYAADGVTLVGDEIYDADVNGALSYSYRKNGTEDAYVEGLPVDAGTYQVKATFAANGNYAESEETATITIKPLPVILIWNNSNYAYDGSEKEVTASITNRKEQNHEVDDVEVLTYETNKKTDIGQYTAKAVSLSGSKKDNYTLARDAYATEDDYDAANISWAWSISFLPQAPSVLAYLDGISGENDWFISDVTLHAPEGYQLSSNLNGPFTDYIEVTTEDVHDIGYYLKSMEHGGITDEINQAYVSQEAYAEKDLTKTTEVIKIDKTAPTGVIEVKENKFKSFINGITFGLFFKNSYDVKMTGADFKQGSDAEEGSRVAKIEYQKVARESDYDADGSWSNYSQLSVEPSGTYVIYVRITDYAGHQTIINTQGIVSYTDAESITEEMAFTKMSQEDAYALIATNGNTIKEISIATAGNTDNRLVSASDYEIQSVGGESNQTKLVLSHEFLQTLPVGKYVITICYNPLGQEYVTNQDESGNDTNESPAATAMALSVEKATRSVEITSDPSKPYDGTEITEPSYVYAGGGTATIEYKKAGESDDGYVTQKPVTVGDYVVRVTISEDLEGNYLACQAEKEFTISQKPIAFVGDSDETFYDGNVHSVNTYTGEEALVSGHYSNVKYFVSAVEADEYQGVITEAQMVVIRDEQGKDVTANYAVTTVPGNLMIRPCTDEWTVDMEDDEAVYDGVAHASTKNPSDTALSGTTTYRYALTEDGEYVSDLSALAWTEVGEYPIYIRAKNPNYETEATTVAWFRIHYWEEAPYAYLSGEKKLEGKDWYVSEVAINAPDGFAIASSPDGEFGSQLVVDTESDQNTMSYYLKETATGRVSTERTQAYKDKKSSELTDIIKIDLHEPTIGRIEDGGVYCESVYFDAEDKFFEKVVVDDQDVTESVTDLGYFIGLDETVASKVQQKHTIEVFDYAGRSMVYHIILHNGHVYSEPPVFEWSEDYTSATATFSCDNDTAHTLVLPCTVKKTEGNEADTYVATVEQDGESYNDTVDIIYSVTSSGDLNEGFDIRLVVSVIEGIDDIPDALTEKDFKTGEDIFQAMVEATVAKDNTYKEVNTKLFDVDLQISKDNGTTWVDVTEDNFPSDGIVICLPYPEGTNMEDYDFIVTHMFTHNFNGHVPGEIEVPAVTETADGIVFRVMSLSPIMVAWTESLTEEPIEDPADDPAEDSTEDNTVDEPADNHTSDKPEDTGTSDHPADTSTSDVPQTDDRNDVWEWYFAMLAGLGFMVFANVRRRKRQ